MVERPSPYETIRLPLNPMECGEIHTFTEVEEFGGGFVPVLNDPPNSPAVPECAVGFANISVASTRIIQGSSLLVTDLQKGVHRFECCIHPWMRMEIEVK